jgi:hypothetical protein
MSSDLIGRRRAVEQRLDRARALELALKEKTEMLAQTTGMSIEQFDFDGSFRASLAALAGLASRRTTFDIIVTLPDAPFGVRLQLINDAVSAEIVVHRDGLYESALVAPSAAESGPAAGEPGFVAVASDLAALLWQGVGDMPS